MNSKNENKNKNEVSSDFEKAGANTKQGNLLKEFVEFLSENKKWWLLPIVIIMLVLGALLLIGGNAPLIYTLF